MDTRTEELVAIGAAVTANCVPCLRHHLGKAREAGAEEPEIRSAVRVGRLVRKGAASAWDKEAAALLGPAEAAAPASQGENAKGCGCS
ncbi:MAG: carboxymuconolactone decarboxylase family protein [Candidatus Tectomicrobia bacterium]|uniref:Carboxymuconolactone decarboxylase family protein n=1 Tax=Tectimicrobiota bacterium TaxID=2528274 RepID=A0A932I553_UNCTE|nr:carboxymuconolactone decarboxylase family protein [Candidatus Tectomicrobia bacterium]